MAKRSVRSRPTPVFDAMSYGPLQYLRSATVGFIMATVLFLIGDASVKQHDLQQELRFFLAIAAAGAVAGWLVAIAANYLVGREIRDERERQSNSLPASPSRLQLPRVESRPANDGGLRDSDHNEPSQAGRSFG